MKKHYLLFYLCLILISCSTTAQLKNDSSNSEISLEKENKVSKNLYKGKDLVIAVTIPQGRDIDKKELWILQYLQDSITGKFAKYSEMTVLDRSNEKLIKAELELSETGFYSDENVVQLGLMTNASLVTVGSIQKIGMIYEINFRINDIATNEIKSSLSNRYTYSEIENGKAVNDITMNLLEGLKIEFSDSEKLSLSTVNEKEDSSVQNLAKGATAEKEKDYISAIVAYSKVEGIQKTEAESNIHSLLGCTFDSSSIQNRVSYYKEQIEKWNTIFDQLEKYMNKNAIYIVYDFSVVQDKIDMHSNNVDLNFSPGIKCVANKTAMHVFATIINEWRKIFYNKENDVWRKEVSEPRCGTLNSNASNVYAYNLYYQYWVSLILVNGNGDVINKKNITVSFWGDRFYDDYERFFMEVEEKSQKKYFEENDFSDIHFYREISLDDIVGDISLKINSITSDKCFERSPLPKDDIWGRKWERKVVYREPAGIFSIDEWNEFVNHN
ncbi:MAG: hypothetical protein J6B63_00015 [Treponema sp.]|nr:hypothetical protein [Treponema sp.]MBP3616389.1 hypothetical protein [Alphaproteobacteria bacterium]